MYLAFIFILFFMFSIYFSLKIRFFNLSFFDKFITIIFLIISLFLFTYSIFFGEFYLPPNKIEMRGKISHSISEKKDFKHIIIEENPIMLDFPKLSYEKLVYYSYFWKFPFLILFIYLISYIFIYLFKKLNNKKNLS